MEKDKDGLFEEADNVETVSLGLYEAGGESGSDFHVFNAAADQYHRAEVLQRTGAIDITCNLVKVEHGAMAADSDRYATLLVMQWYFKPKNARRISEATIELLFVDATGAGDLEVEKISFPDTYSLMPTTQQESLTRGGDATIGVSQVVTASVSGKWEKTVSHDKSDAITLSGGMRVVDNRPPNRIASWTVSENHSQPQGIPASLKVAVLLSRSDREKFYCKLAFTAKTDARTTAESIFKKIPKDDPIIFQPNPREKGTRPNKTVSYGNDELGSVDLEELSDVTFRTVINNAQKTRK
ncbi:hypothetical protein BX600DRAFT_467014 [Xylariales sp. PMI_506]|nr:hypothetical protein BX600DRAFT_467014 [Xylariales sp. PMI_506]